MPGTKRRYVSDAREVPARRSKLRPQPRRSSIIKISSHARVREPPFPQRFSLPLSILSYVAQNPLSPNGHLKLISTCKAFLRMNRMIPVKRLTHSGFDHINNWRVDCRRLINLKNHKLWICDQLSIRSIYVPDLASTLVKHVSKFSPRDLTVVGQVLTFGEFQFLVSGGNLKFVEFESNVIKNPDGNATEFEKIFELLCCKSLLISLHQKEHGIGKDTTSKIIEILSSDQIPAEQDITLWNIPEDFDFQLFSGFLKDNMTGKKHSFELSFCDDISPAYRNQLQLFVKEVIQMRGIYDHVVPVISFPGQNLYAYHKLKRMRYASTI